MEIVSTPAVEDETIFVPRCNWHHPLRQDPRCIARLSNLTIHFLCNIVQSANNKRVKYFTTSFGTDRQDYHEKTIGKNYKLKCIQEAK